MSWHGRVGILGRAWTGSGITRMATNMNDDEDDEDADDDDDNDDDDDHEGK